MDQRQAMLMAQINQRRAVRDQALARGGRKAGYIMSPALREHLIALQREIMDQAEKLYDLSLLLEEIPGGRHALTMIDQSATTLQTLYQRGKTLYQQAGQPAPLGERLIILRAAVVRLQSLPDTKPEEYAALLSEVVFLLADAAQLL